MYRWIKGFSHGWAFQVRNGKCYSGTFIVEKGKPQGSIVSPLLFSIMINYVFVNFREKWDTLFLLTMG